METQPQQEKEYLKCNGCKCLRELNEYEVYKGTRRKTCLKCKAYRVKYTEKNTCKHGKRKSQCKECGGSAVCEHRRQKSRCKECGGGSFCEHGKRKSRCIECGGSSICEHGKQKQACRICNLELCLIKVQRKSIHRMLKNSKFTKVQHTVEYLGCDGDYFQEYLKKKMTDEMTWENIHIDHIKPVSRFNLDDPDEFLDCCHYTNLQPLLAKDNMEKGNKWTEQDEIYWKENIRGIETTEIYKSFQ